MIVGTDFSLGEGGEKTTPEPPTAPPPVVVIEYRHRGFAARWVPPALILLTALGVSSYQRTTPVRVPGPGYRLPPRESAPSTADTPSPEIVVRAERRAGEEDKALQAARAESPATSPDASAAPIPPALAMTDPGGGAPTPSPFELGPADGLRPLDPSPEPAVTNPTPEPARAPEHDPAPEPAVTNPTPGEPETIPGPAPQPAPEPTKEEILRDIQREADEKEARRQTLADLKPRARALLQAETIAKVQGDRALFHDELRRVLKNPGENAGDEIDRLCNRFGRDMAPEIRAAYNRALRIAPKRSSRQWMVEMMRSNGLPEPVILDYLAHGLHKTLNTRGGPRDEDEVRIRAAKALLNIPVNSARRTARSPVEPGSPDVHDSPRLAPARR